MFALLESAINDLAQQAGVMVQGADITPVDLIWVGLEMVVAQGLQANQHRVDLERDDDGDVIIGTDADGHNDLMARITAFLAANA